jgi:sugar (pentulose or hexulose) kinase
MAAALAAGLYRNFDEAAARMVRTKRIVEPDKSTAAVYDNHYARYGELYRQLNGTSAQSR